MTFCVGLRTKQGLVAVADTRLTSGELDFVITSRKVFTFERDKHAMFIMLSGLKSLSDMVLTYINERKEYFFSCAKLYQGVDLIAKIVREIRAREETWLKQGDVDFDLNYLVGGQFPEDDHAQLFRIYPEAAWKRIARDSPFEIIGEARYGKSLLEAAANFQNSMEKTKMLALLAFNATMRSYPLCSPPIDVIQYTAGSFRLKQKRLLAKPLLKLSGLWDAEVNKALNRLLKRAKPPG
ncbi:MAG: hypothetical protein LBQ83_01295 [Candidatus Margulisbacteria bacterium]|jgi:putative proteasome-type protease|nr:hypothetical protein [Candidatus Margulisiibacteriota bacterium]